MKEISLGTLSCSQIDHNEVKKCLHCCSNSFLLSIYLSAIIKAAVLFHEMPPYKNFFASACNIANLIRKYTQQHIRKNIISWNLKLLRYFRNFIIRIKQIHFYTKLKTGALKVKQNPNFFSFIYF